MTMITVGDYDAAALEGFFERRFPEMRRRHVRNKHDAAALDSDMFTLVEAALADMWRDGLPAWAIKDAAYDYLTRPDAPAMPAHRGGHMPDDRTNQRAPDWNEEPLKR